MAWFVNIAVECEVEVAARAVATILHGRKVVAASRDVDVCNVGCTPQNGLWYAYAEPRGVGCNEGPRIDELCTKEAIEELREEFYHILRGCSGFRRAIFAEEAFDGLVCWSDPGDFMHFAWPHMVLREDLIQDDRELRSLSVSFSPGYVCLKGIPEGLEYFRWRENRDARKRTPDDSKRSKEA